MNDIGIELGKAVSKTVAAQEHLSGQVQYRNHMIREALASGMTWVQVMKVTGLSRGMIASIVKGGK